LSTKPFFIFDKFILCNVRPEFSNHELPQNLPMPHLLVWSLLFYFLSKTILFIGTYSLLIIC
jgi:hypothetical protein